MQGILDITAVYGQGDALGGGVGGCFREIDQHGLIGWYDDRFAGQVFEGGLVEEVHDLFSPDHAGDDKVPEGEGHPVAGFIAFENIQLAILQVKNTPVLRQRLKVLWLCEGYIF